MRTKLLTSNTYSPTNPASEAAIRQQIDDSIQEVYDAAGKDAEVVKIDGNQTINDIKTFSSSPIVPVPTTEFQAAPKKYVDEAYTELVLAAVVDGSILDVKLSNDPGQIKGVVAEHTRQLNGTNNVKSYLCDDGQYVQGDGTHDDTTGIQRAFDNARGSVIFPKGIYKVTGVGVACLTLTRNIDIVGFNTRDSVIRADSIGATTDVIKIEISDNFGYLDVRNWSFKNLTVFINGGGRHALNVSGGLQMLTSKIENCNLAGTVANSGYGLFIENNFSHGKISLNTFNSIYLKCYDANKIEKNLFSGNRPGIILDLIEGVRNNVVKDNTIITRDASVHVVNGSNIRIQNNQCEQPSLSQGLYKTMIWIEGVDRPCENIIVSENNFGGGTNLDRLIYLDNAYKAVVEKNYLIAVNTAEIELTANARYCIIKFDNSVLSQVSNPRTRTAFKANVVDNGVGTSGVLKLGTTLGLQNSWTGGDYYKTETGQVVFFKTFNAGVTTSGTVIGTLPLGFRPSFDFYIPYGNSSGSGKILITTAGVISLSGAAASNSGISLCSFSTATTD